MPPYPNLFIIGAQKAGTTSLFHYLRQHEAIFMPDAKDPGFFSDLAVGEASWDEEQEYLAHFEGSDGYPIRGDASQYMHHPETADLIHERVPDAKIIASLRDPMQRAYSHYWRQVAAGIETASFPEVVERELDAMQTDTARIGYFDRSRYADGIQRYQTAFGAEHVHVILLDDLKTQPRQTLREILTFLDVDPSPADTIELSRQNTFRGTPYNGPIETLRTHPTLKRVARTLLPKQVRDWLGNDVLLSNQSKPLLPEDVKPLLAEFFEPDIQRLEELLDRDLDPLRASYPPQRRQANP